MINNFFFSCILYFLFLWMQIEPIVLVHGGAGDIPDSRDQGKLIGCKLAVRRGYDRLNSSGSVLEAVEEAVRSMELDDNFNAGATKSINIWTKIFLTKKKHILNRLWFRSNFGRNY